MHTCPSGRLILNSLSLSAHEALAPAVADEMDCDLRELSELERDRTVATVRRLVAPLPASRLFSSEGLRAQMNA